MTPQVGDIWEWSIGGFAPGTCCQYEITAIIDDAVSGTYISDGPYGTLKGFSENRMDTINREGTLSYSRLVTPFKEEPDVFDV